MEMAGPAPPTVCDRLFVLFLTSPAFWSHRAGHRAKGCKAGTLLLGDVLPRLVLSAGCNTLQGKLFLLTAVRTHALFTS